MRNPSLSARFHQGLLAAMLLSCRPPQSTEAEAPAEGAPDMLPRPVIEIQLPLAVSVAPLRWEGERLGLITLLVEAGLADLHGVVPVVADIPPSPGFGATLQTGQVNWTSGLRIEPDGADMAVVLTLCDPGLDCQELRGVSPPENPYPAVAAVLEQAAKRLDRPTWPGLVEQWSSPASADEYAILLCGRAAGAWYGLLAPAPPEARGDKRRDPIDRAVYVDPLMADGWWMVARRAALFGELDAAGEALDLAREGRPTRIAILADSAWILEKLGRVDQAVELWKQIESLSPDDHRFSLARARALLAAGRGEEARQIAEHLDETAPMEPAVVALEVAISDVLDPGGASDALLERWQQTAATDPEPVRRRIRWRVAEGRYAEALPLAEELANRGEEEASAGLVMALALGVEDWARAAEGARDLGRPDLAERIKARASLGANARNIPPEIADDPDAAAGLARGWAHLAAGRPGEALAEAQALLQADPWLPEALALEVESQQALGQDAAVARARLAWADPEWKQPGM